MNCIVLLLLLSCCGGWGNDCGCGNRCGCGSIGTAAMRRRGPAAMAAEPGMAGEKGPAVSPMTMAAGGKGPAVSPVTMAVAGRRGTADVTRLRQA